jgi:hypothetical protein
MSEAGPRRGELVVYNGVLYFFQPNGTSCYLYVASDEVGKRELALYSPNMKSVRKATEAETLLVRHLVPQPSAPLEPLELLVKSMEGLKIDSQDSVDDNDEKK